MDKEYYRIKNIPENFLLLRFVATRFCNFRCPYCYLSDEKRAKEKNMFTFHSPDEWAAAVERLSDRTLELYFTGGEPLLLDGLADFLAKAVEMKHVSCVRIDSNLSPLKRFLKKVDSPKIRFLASFHPTHVPFDKFMEKLELLKGKGMLGMVNVVASKENIKILDKGPNELIAEFDARGMFLNVAKDFERGLKLGYNKKYKDFIDKLQHPQDNAYMNKIPSNEGVLCGSGKHYISVNRHGNLYSCPEDACHGNLFGQFDLPGGLCYCSRPICPSIISYSFSQSNCFSPSDHLSGYVKRNIEHRRIVSREYLEKVWCVLKEEDFHLRRRMPILATLKAMLHK